MNEGTEGRKLKRIQSAYSRTLTNKRTMGCPNKAWHALGTGGSSLC